MKKNIISAHELRVLEDSIDDAQDKIMVVEKLRGKALCCEDPDNIEFESLPVGGAFDPGNKTHVENATKGQMKAFCIHCGSKYWTDKFKKGLVSRV